MRVEGRRVAISGLGAISALGREVAEGWRAAVGGRSGIGPIESLALDDLKFRNGAEVRGFDPGEHFDPRRLGLLDRFAQLLLVAAREAIADAGLAGDERLAERTAVVTGSSLGGQTTQDQLFCELYGGGRKRIHPLTIPRIMANAGAGHLSMELGVTGPVFTLSTACSSSAHAVGLAFWLVRQGVVDLAVAGGSEAPFSWGNLKAWEGLRSVSPDTCRPFSKDRQGMILGEGGAALVLEPLEAALERGAPVHAEIVGCGMSSDAHHITQPLAEGAARALRGALADGGLEGEEVGYVNAHGTGTLANDPTETRAIRRVFGAHADRLAVSSTKSLHGHTLGAAGALEAVLTVLALEDGVLPPTANFTVPDPECDLDVVPNRSRRQEVDAALSSSFAFGGLNVVLAFRRWRG
jgi:nodulation protein E